VARNRRVGGVGQPELDDRGTSLLNGRIGRHAREEAIDDHLQDFIALQFDRSRAADQPRTATEQGQLHRLGCIGGQQLFLGHPAARCQLRKARR